MKIDWDVPLAFQEGDKTAWRSWRARTPPRRSLNRYQNYQLREITASS
jgi:hypothetical protein